jgi:alpha-L-arabinofuranosidase
MKKSKNAIRFLNLLRMGLMVMTIWGFGIIIVQAQAPNSTLTIDLSKPGHSISPILYNGVLFEEISHGVDGGFYAQLIRNGSFEDNDTLDAWSLVKAGYSAGAISGFTTTYIPEAGETGQLNSNQVHCLKFNISSVSTGSVGVANAGYWGIRLDNNTTYKASFFAKKDADFTGTLTVKLESNSGTAYGTSGTVTPTTSWQKFSCDLATSGISGITGDNRFVIYGSAVGTLYFDVVRLMPPAYKDRPNGMRIDMAEMQAALHPKLIRFPGGCDVEHTNVDIGWNWKKAIGPIEQRPGEIVQRWGYHNSQQFGLDEMFRMCEDWGAEPIYCTSMSINDHFGAAPMDQMQPFVQDLLDIIEYANGDAKTNKWGKLRSANGHSAPYNLKYIEVGNEDGFDKDYHERYALFYNAIKEACPNMNVIINDTLNGQKADVLDEHFYRNQSEFLQLSTRYDNYDRKGPKIVVGEYSDKENATEVGDLRCAIGEAAFLTGCERNSDIVISTTYGTLSGNVNAISWYPNLYYNNSVSCFAIPSYYMEKMFVENTGDVVLPYALSGSLYVAPSRVNSNGDVIIKVVNSTDNTSNTLITLNGAPEKRSTKVTVTTLTSGDLSDENSIAQPTKVIPSTSTFIAAGSSFNYPFPANSITVVRLDY